MARMPEKFTSADGGQSVEFPVREWDSSQELVIPGIGLVGADYLYDLLDRDLAMKGNGDETVRFMAVEDSAAELNATLDNLRSKLFRFGRGKFWTIDEAGQRRWAWARLEALPEIRLDHLNISVAPVVLAFTRSSDWQGEAQNAVTEALSATPAMFNVTNAGNAIVRDIVIELQAKSAAGFQDLTITNLTNGGTFSSTRVAESNQSRLQIDTGRYLVRYSNDGGATWTNDYGNFSYPAEQVEFFTVGEGTNGVRYEQGTGVPGLDIIVRYYDTWD